MLSPEELRMLGASDFGSLLHLSEYGGPIALWARIVHGVRGETTQAMEEGTLAEPYIRSLYQRRTGYALLGPAKWRHPLYPWLRCSPDDRAATPERRVLELKRYRPEGWGPEGSDMVPIAVWVQVQVQIGVGLDNGELEQEHGDVAALIRGDLRLYSVPFQAEVYERCLSAGERFWVDFVVPKRLPEGPRLRVLERDVQAIHALFPAPTLEEPLAWEMLSPQQQETVARWLEANRARKTWERHEAALAGEVEAILREAPGLALPEGLGKRIDYRATKPQARIDLKGLREEAGGVSDRSSILREALEKHTTQESNRPLRAY